MSWGRKVWDQVQMQNVSCRCCNCFVLWKRRLRDRFIDLVYGALRSIHKNVDPTPLVSKREPADKREALVDRGATVCTKKGKHGSAVFRLANMRQAIIPGQPQRHCLKESPYPRHFD